MEVDDDDLGNFSDFDDDIDDHDMSDNKLVPSNNNKPSSRGGAAVKSGGGALAAMEMELGLHHLSGGKTSSIKSNNSSASHNGIPAALSSLHLQQQHSCAGCEPA